MKFVFGGILVSKANVFHFLYNNKYLMCHKPDANKLKRRCGSSNSYIMSTFTSNQNLWESQTYGLVQHQHLASEASRGLDQTLNPFPNDNF